MQTDWQHVGISLSVSEEKLWGLHSAGCLYSGYIHIEQEGCERRCNMCKISVYADNNKYTIFNYLLRLIAVLS